MLNGPFCTLAECVLSEQLHGTLPGAEPSVPLSLAVVGVHGRRIQRWPFDTASAERDSHNPVCGQKKNKNVNSTAAE